MKQKSQHPKCSSSKQKETKREGTAVAEASQSRVSKQTITNKSQNMRSPSSVRSNSKKLDAKSLTQKSKERKLESVITKEEKSRKRKKEEEQKNPNSNGTKSPTQEAKRRKETKMEPEKNSGKIFQVQQPSQGKGAESRKPEPDMKLKKTKASVAKTSARNSSVGTSSQTLVKRGNASSKSEQGKYKKQKERGNQNKVKPNDPNSKQVTRAKNHDSLSHNAGPSRSKGQTQIVLQEKPRASSHGQPVKIHQNHKDVGKNKSPKATKNESLSTTLVEKSRKPSTRCLKIMRSLGLIPPAESPFIRTVARL